MSLIISNSYFTRDIAVPQLGNDLLLTDFASWLTAYELEYLEKALGYSFAHELIAGLSEDPVNAKWLDLINGKTYEVDGVQYRWEGLKNQTLLKSAIADYVYFFYSRDKVSQQSGYGGENRQTGENATGSSIQRRSATVWNRMIKTTREMWNYLILNPTTYDTFDINQVRTDYFNIISPIAFV